MTLQKIAALGKFWNDSIALVTSWIVAFVAQAGVLFALLTPRFASPSPFAGNVSVILATAALIATFWSLFPVAVLSACL